MKIIRYVFSVLFTLLMAYVPLKAAATKPVFQNKSQTTVIYLVRHAEKNTMDPEDKDPDLTPAGYARAQALQQYFQKIPVDAYFSTPYQRTRLTIEPLAKGQEIITYQAHGYQNLRKVITQKYAGKTVVVVGHSNTLLNMIETFGAQKPVPAIADSKYDYIFKVTLRPGKKTKVETATYGVPTT